MTQSNGASFNPSAAYAAKYADLLSRTRNFSIIESTLRGKKKKKKRTLKFIETFIFH